MAAAVPSVAPPGPVVEAPLAPDVPAIAALNNRFAPDGLTLPRSERWVALHLADYRIVRGEDGGVLGCVALDEYSPSLVELVSLAVDPTAHGRGLGRRLIEAAASLAARRGYPEIFSVSLADRLFLAAGFLPSSIDVYPEKAARYAAISRSELTLGKKFLFTRRLALSHGSANAAV